MQPNYQPQYPAAPAPQYPQQSYPVQPAYPAQGYPQQPAMPQYPAQPAYPQQYAAPAPAPAAPPIPAGTLDSFYDQPSSGGGPAWKFNGKPDGTTYAGIVARAVTNADVRHQTNNNGQVQTFRDGRPKLVMVVPMQVQPSQEHPEGVATWWVKGQARDELTRAMAEAGAPAGGPEAGALIQVTKVGERRVPNMNPQILYRVQYTRPQGATPAQIPAAPVTQAAPVAQPAPAPVAVPPQVPAQPVAPVAQPAPVAAPAAQAPLTPPAGQLGPEQAQLWAQLTGQQPAAA